MGEGKNIITNTYLKILSNVKPVIAGVARSLRFIIHGIEIKKAEESTNIIFVLVANRESTNKSF